MVGTIVSFLVTSVILKADKTEDTDESFTESATKSKAMKAEGKNLLKGQTYKKISFACDAGMGSSALGASAFKKMLKNNGITDIEVKHYRIEDVPKDSDVVVIHKDLAERFELMNTGIRIVSIESYLKDPNIDDLISDVLASSK